MELAPIRTKAINAYKAIPKNKLITFRAIEPTKCPFLINLNVKVRETKNGINAPNIKSPKLLTILFPKPNIYKNSTLHDRKKMPI
ncbi:hypothetical protein [Saccharolobus shibatae]|uniref:hypothetical protein n=1 Tax=Saccharolobus shibatae TaxID=2286 RepID=UPI001C479ACB|nr:hypothetical protein [Saccharolobus shibatae]